MREEDSNWFAKWEEQLPSPEELMPISVTLITPDLAKAFDIRNPNSPHHHHHHPHHQEPPPPPPPPPPPSQAQNTPSSQHNSSAEFDSSELGGTGGGSGGAGAASGGEEPARTLKRPRLVWTPQLHKRFVDAVAHLGIKNAVPKTIMQLMSVDGLTRENVASHLQKYRLYLKRMQVINGGGSGGGLNGNATMAAAGGSDTDHLFASSPVPAHFLHPGRPNSDHYLPFVPVTAMQHHPMAAVVGHHHHHAQLQQQFRHFGTSPPNAQFEHPFLSRQSQQQQVQRIGTPVHNTTSVIPSYVEDMESATAASNGRKVLTLFPTGDD